MLYTSTTLLYTTLKSIVQERLFLRAFRRIPLVWFEITSKFEWTYYDKEPCKILKKFNPITDSHELQVGLLVGLGVLQSIGEFYSERKWNCLETWAHHLVDHVS